MGPAAVCYHRVNSLMKSPLHSIALLSHGCWRSCSVEWRCSGSFLRHRSTKLQNSGVHRFESIFGGSFWAILYKTLVCYSLIYGGSPCASSTTKMPNDHTSTLLSYRCFPLIISGAIQHTVPTLLYLVVVSLVSWTAYPKSASLIDPVVETKILSDLMSLCKICRSWRYLSPYNTQ